MGPPPRRVRRSSTIVHGSDLGDVLGSLGEPLVVGLVGTRHMDAIADTVIEFGDLVAIPDAWLRGLPVHDLQRRANVASRILTAHSAAPLRHYVGGDRAALPF